MAQLLYVIASLHVILCPFTKVEESFNIQALHDILYHRHNLSQYDHNEFPGVVPRTFVGPVVISALSAPVGSLLYLFGINKFWMQYVVRLTLALTVIAAWSRLRNALQKQFGNTFAWWFTVITVTQYHFMFYMSRPLPNILALPLVLLAFEGWISGNHKQFLISAGASMIIFRSELAVLFGLFLIIDLYFKKVDVVTLLKTVVLAGVGLIALTVIVDSIFWGRLLWPEAEVFWYNTVMNKSSDWGTSPFLWYFYSALPRGLGPSLVLVPVGLYLDRRLVPIAAPAFVYVLLYSMLPHKELRFIIYVFPLLNMASAAACSYIFMRRTKAPIYELLFWGATVVVLGNVLLSVAFVSVAMTNYPGGVAMIRFHKLLKNEPFVHVHISNLAAQTGVTRFTEIHDHWKYSKNESLEPEQLHEYTHLLMEAKSKYSSNLKAFSHTHVVLEGIEAFSSVSLSYKLLPPIKIKTRPTLFILERKDFRDYPQGHKVGSIESIETREEIDSNEVEASTEYNDVDEESVTNVEEGNFGLQESQAEPLLAEEQLVQYEEQTIADEEAHIIPDTDNLPIEETVVQQEEEEDKEINHEPTENSAILEKPKMKRAIEELKSLKKERKRKAIFKIKSETRKEVAASAKEKLRELMKRHKQIAKELSDDVKTEEKGLDEVYGRGDIPESETVHEEPNLVDVGTIDMTAHSEKEDMTESVPGSEEITGTNQNIDDIVEEVIVRLIDRKIYDDKTKPEDIRAQDRQVIQQIVEEILSEKMNYSRFTQ